MNNPSASRRPALRGVQPHASTNAGLWLDRYLAYQTSMPDVHSDTDDVKEARAELIRQAASTILMPEGYATLARARQVVFAHKTPGRTRQLRLYETTTRLIVGLGQKGVTEAGIRLEHTWGVPYIPGSSLKGLAAAVAHQQTTDAAWQRGDNASDPKGQSHGALFGELAAAGKISFYDAWWLPSSNGAESALAEDIITVHQPSYYQSTKSGDDIPAPDGTDSPVPNSFLCVRPKISFCIGLECADADTAWLEAAWTFLDYGLTKLGVGAKTNAGYGRLEYKEQSSKKLQNDWESAREGDRLREAYEAADLGTQLALILEHGKHQLYAALSQFEANKTTPETFLAQVPVGAVPLPGSAALTLRPASAEELYEALKQALAQDEDWFAVLRKGDKPIHWALDAGSRKLRELGDTLLGPRLQDESPAVEAEPEFSEIEKQLLANLRQSNGLPNIDGAEAAVAHANTSINDDWLLQFEQDMRALGRQKSLDKAEKKRLKGYESSIKKRRKTIAK